LWKKILPFWREYPPFFGGKSIQIQSRFCDTLDMTMIPCFPTNSSTKLFLVLALFVCIIAAGINELIFSLNLKL
jgi:hypothetical protein